MVLSRNLWGCQKEKWVGQEFLEQSILVRFYELMIDDEFLFFLFSNIYNFLCELFNSDRK